MHHQTSAAIRSAQEGGKLIIHLKQHPVQELASAGGGSSAEDPRRPNVRHTHAKRPTRPIKQEALDKFQSKRGIYHAHLRDFGAGLFQPAKAEGLRAGADCSNSITRVANPSRRSKQIDHGEKHRGAGV